MSSGKLGRRPASLSSVAEPAQVDPALIVETGMAEGLALEVVAPPAPPVGGMHIAGSTVTVALQCASAGPSTGPPAEVPPLPPEPLPSPPQPEAERLSLIHI